MKSSAKPFEPNAVPADDPAVVTAIDFVLQPGRSCRVPVGSRRLVIRTMITHSTHSRPKPLQAYWHLAADCRKGVRARQTLGFPVGVPSYPAPMGVRAGAM
jgi:hypothetical protein